MAARRSLDETRDLLLDAGVDILIHDGISFAVAGFSLIDVCRHAGLKTSGSAYKIWPNQEDFRVELLRHALDASNTDSPTIRPLMESLLDGDDTPSLTELIRSISALNVSFYIGDPKFNVFLALWCAAGSDPVLAGLIQASDESALNAFANIYEVVADAYDLEWVEPFNSQLLATTLAALMDGLAIRARYDPSSVPSELPRATGPGDEIQQWHLAACGVQALVAKFLRPR